MPARPPGVYQNAKGKWYFKVTVGQDPLTGRRNQITRRGFQTMAEAARERREVLAKVDSWVSNSRIAASGKSPISPDGARATSRSAPFAPEPPCANSWRTKNE